MIVPLVLPSQVKAEEVQKTTASYLVKASDYQKVEADLQELGVTNIKKIDALKTFEIETTQDVIDILAKKDGILGIEKDGTTKTAETVNDPYFSQQPYISDSTIDSAWTISAGSQSTIVAVVDTGVNYYQEDIANQMWKNPQGYYGYDFANGDNNPIDDNGHGTMVAGIIAATKNNGKGIAGVANVKIMAVKVAPAQEEGEVSDLVRGIIYAADNGAKIINISMGTTQDSFVLDEAVSYARNKGALIVSSSGNEGAPSVRNPARNPNVIGVGALNIYGLRSSYSNYGAGLGITALGDDIISTGFSPNDYYTAYQKGSGTSFSTPQVAGVAALLLAKDPSLSADQLRKRILSTATKTYYMAGLNYSTLYGYGKLNAYGALTGDKTAPIITNDYFYKNPDGSFKFTGHAQDEKGSQVILANTPESNVASVKLKIGNGNWQDVVSGAKDTATIDITLPAATSGNYSFMLDAYDTAGNHGTKVFNTSEALPYPVSRSAQSYTYQLVEQSSSPVNISAGQKATMRLGFLNTGTSLWTKSGVRLGTSRPTDRKSAFYDSSWMSQSRVEMKENYVSPGEIAHFEFTITAPNGYNGTFKEYFNLVAEGITWMRDIGIYWEIRMEKPSYHARYIGQSPLTPMTVGEERLFWVDYENTGAINWEYPTARLGTSSPLDHASVFYNSRENTGWISSNRAILSNKYIVQPGEIGRFGFIAKAPQTKGTYKEYFRPVIDGVAWLEDYGLYWEIEVK